MDEHKLYQCLLAFQRLIDIKYHIVLGRAGKSVSFDLTFTEYDCHHLMGIHYLADRPDRRSTAKIFEELITSAEFRSHIVSSDFWSRKLIILSLPFHYHKSFPLSLAPIPPPGWLILKSSSVIPILFPISKAIPCNTIKYTVVELFGTISHSSPSFMRCMISFLSTYSLLFAVLRKCHKPRIRATGS